MDVSKLDELIDTSHFIDDDKKEACKKYFKEIHRGLENWFYSSSMPSDTYQGDIIDNLDVIYYEINEDRQETRVIGDIPCMLLSRTCDIAFKGKNRDSYISIVPIISFEEFAESKNPAYSDEGWRDFLDAVKANRITDILFIPGKSPLKDSIVFLDHICSIDPHVLQFRFETQKSKKILSLSQLGYYLFLIKLTNHFAGYEDRTEIIRQ